MNSRKAVGTNSEATVVAPEVPSPPPKKRPSTGQLKALRDLERIQFGALDRTSRD